MGLADDYCHRVRARRLMPGAAPFRTAKRAPRDDGHSEGVSAEGPRVESTMELANVHSKLANPSIRGVSSLYFSRGQFEPAPSRARRRS